MAQPTAAKSERSLPGLTQGVPVGVELLGLHEEVIAKKLEQATFQAVHLLQRDPTDLRVVLVGVEHVVVELGCHCQARCHQAMACQRVHRNLRVLLDQAVDVNHGQNEAFVRALQHVPQAADVLRDGYRRRPWRMEARTRATLRRRLDELLQVAGQAEHHHVIFLGRRFIGNDSVFARIRLRRRLRLLPCALFRSLLALGVRLLLLLLLPVPRCANRCQLGLGLVSVSALRLRLLMILSPLLLLQLGPLPECLGTLRPQHRADLLVDHVPIPHHSTPRWLSVGRP
mmetsp:Transcript_125489/g.363075  ORF Transcript_125489/g.363075 Transcript_125489/m.363075 type:complete len:285 (-) Transcript_125489:155-1009(-)